MNFDPFVTLDIGSTHVVALVGEADHEGRITVIGKGIHVSKGVHKGQIVDIQNVTSCITEAIKQATDDAETDIGELYLSIGGGEIRSKMNHGRVSLDLHNHVVTAEEIEEVQENARMENPSPDYTRVHAIPVEYQLDGKGGIKDPINLAGSSLCLDLLLLDAPTMHIQNMRNAVSSAMLNVKDYVFSGMCAALAVLSEEQKRAGVAVIDLGGGTTDYAVYVNGSLVAASSLAIGGDHITADIGYAFNIQQSRADDIKHEHGNALVEGMNERISVPADIGFREGTISSRALRTVINARMDETLHILREDFIERDLLSKLGAGIVFTGGGASLGGLTELARQIFGVPCIVGTPHNVLGLQNEEAPNSLAVAAGGLIYAYKEAVAKRQKRFSLRKWLGL